MFPAVSPRTLEGLLFGDDSDGGDEAKLELGGHQVDFTVAPIGLSRGVIGATVSF